MKYQSFLVRRYLRTRFIPYAAVLAVALGVFVLIAALSVMEGFKHEMRDRIRGSLSHLTVLGDTLVGLWGEEEVLAALSELEHVESVSPYVRGMGLFRTRGIDSCVFRGIDPIAEARVGEFGNYLLRQSEWAKLLMDLDYELPDDRVPLTEEEIAKVFSLEWRKRVFSLLSDGGEGKGFEDERPPQPIVVGIEALRHGTMALGNIVKISSFSPLDKQPKSQDFLVVGTFRTGVFEQDLSWIYMPLRASQEFLDLYDEELNDYRFSGVSMRLDDYEYADEVKAAISRDVAPHLDGRDLDPRTWEERRKTLLAAVDIEKKIIFAMMLFIVFFAGVMIFLILALMAIEKTRDIGVLESLGASSNGVVGIFMRLGMSLTIAGILLGWGTGWLFTENINAIHDLIGNMFGVRLFPPDIYYLTEIPVRRDSFDLLLVTGAALSFGFLGSLVPALWAARKDPVKTLRYE